MAIIDGSAFFSNKAYYKRNEFELSKNGIQLFINEFSIKDKIEFFDWLIHMFKNKIEAELNHKKGRPNDPLYLNSYDKHTQKTIIESLYPEYKDLIEWMENIFEEVNRETVLSDMDIKKNLKQSNSNDIDIIKKEYESIESIPERIEFLIKAKRDFINANEKHRIELKINAEKEHEDNVFDKFYNQIYSKVEAEFNWFDNELEYLNRRNELLKENKQIIPDFNYQETKIIWNYNEIMAYSDSLQDNQAKHIFLSYVLKELKVNKNNIIEIYVTGHPRYLNAPTNYKMANEIYNDLKSNYKNVIEDLINRLELEKEFLINNNLKQFNALSPEEQQKLYDNALKEKIKGFSKEENTVIAKQSKNNKKIHWKGNEESIIYLFMSLKNMGLIEEISFTYIQSIIPQFFYDGKNNKEYTNTQLNKVKQRLQDKLEKNLIKYPDNKKIADLIEELKLMTD